MAGNDGKKPGRSGAAKPPVIDLQAKKVGQEGAGKEKAGQEKPAEERKKAAASTARAAKAAGSNGKAATTDKSGKAGAAANAKDAPSDARAEKKDGKKQAAEKQAKEKREKRRGGGGWKFLLGLLLLGGAAGGGAWVYQQYGPQKQLAALQQRLAALEQKAQAAASGDALQGLRQQVQKLEQQQQKLAASLRELSKGDGGELPLKVKALEEKLAQVEKLAPALRENAERTAALEKTLANLQQQMDTLKKGLDELAAKPAAATGEGEGGAAADGGSTAATASMAASGAAVVALKLSVQELQQKLAALNEQMAALRTAADPARMEALEGRIAKQEQALIRAQEELRGLAQQAQVHAERASEQAQAAIKAVEELRANPPTPKFTPPPQAVAYAALRAKAKAGEPFKAELDKLAALMPGTPALDTLAPLAKKGVPSAEALAGQLADLRKALVKKQAEVEKPAADDPLAVLKQRLGKMVKVRRAGEVDWPQLLKRAEEKLATGGLAAALAELAPHAEGAPPEVAKWLARAQARQKVDKALDALAEAVLQQAGQTAQ